MTRLVSFFFAIAICCMSFAEGIGKADSNLSARQLRRYKALYMEAVCQREAGNLVAYYRMLERAVSINPNGAEALFELAQMGLLYEVPVPVEEYLAKAHELVPDNADYAYELGRLYLAMDDGRGLELMRSLLPNEDLRDVAYAQLCSYYEVKANYDSLCAVLEQWRPIKDDDEFVSSHKMQAAMQLGRLPEALLIADTLMAVSPSDRSHYAILKGEVLLGMNRPDEALEIYNQVADDEQYMAEAQILLYKYALTTGKKDVEQQSLRAMVINPRMPMQTRVAALKNFVSGTSKAERKVRQEALLEELLPLQEEDATLYAVLIDQMQQDNAADSLMIPLYNKLLNIDPSDEYSRLHLMQDALRHQNYSELNRLSTDGLKENPRHPLFYYFAGAALNIEKKDTAALEMFRRGLEFIDGSTHTELVSSYYCSYADALYKNGRKDEAYVMYDSALVYNSENVMCLNNYAYFLSLDNKNLDKAKQMSAKTLEQDAEEPTYLDTYAWILFLKGEYEQARKYMDLAIKFTDDLTDPENVSLLEHAGDIYYHLGQANAALNYWRQAYKVTPDSEILKKKVQNQKYYKE